MFNLRAIFRHPFNRNKRSVYRRTLKNTYFKGLIAGVLKQSPHQKTILMVTHNWGGGTDRHIRELTSSVRSMANIINARFTEMELEFTILDMPDVRVKIAKTDIVEVINTLREFHVNRLHIHQIIGNEAIIRMAATSLSIPFDITVHDYYLICPQMHLCTPRAARYCGERGNEQCDECIAINKPFGASDIQAWRTDHAWFVENAERVICPTRDVQDRIARYYPRANLVVAPHEANTSDSWVVKAQPLSVGQPLRVALIGHLIAHKGREIVEACLKQCAGIPIEFVLIGAAQPPIPAVPGERFLETGVYNDLELIGYLEKLAPQVIWFPQPVPETYSYTLTAAIESGLPIVATRIGALGERLEGPATDMACGFRRSRV